MEATALMTSACDSAAGATRHPAARIGQMLFWLCVVAMVLARIWLVSDEDIIASETPHDALWTVKVADRGYWGEAEHDHLTLIRPPAYPLWLSAVRFLGIPQRTGIELAYIGAAALLAYAICAAGAFRWMALLAFALILSSPYPLTIFRWTLTDALNAPLMMVLAALLVLAICAYSWRGR